MRQKRRDTTCDPARPLTPANNLSWTSMQIVRGSIFDNLLHSLKASTPKKIVTDGSLYLFVHAQNGKEYSQNSVMSQIGQHQEH